MSKQRCIEFMTAVKQDAEIQTALNSAENRQQFEQRLVELGSRNGYEFTLEDAAAVIDDMEQASTTGNLSEGELEKVSAAGRGDLPCPDTTITVPDITNSNKSFCTCTLGNACPDKKAAGR